jgi:hypothetical protein
MKGNLKFLDRGIKINMFNMLRAQTGKNTQHKGRERNVSREMETLQESMEK